MLKTSSITEQVATHLREELKRRRWTKYMPGRGKLAEELGVNVKTVERALAKLEHEGLLVSQGAGRRRKIVATKQRARPVMQVRMILYERDDAFNHYILGIRRALDVAGHGLSFAPKTLLELKQDPKRVARMVKAEPAQAWIVVAGARPVLEWFAKASVEAFALFGRLSDLPIAGTGPDKRPTIREAIDKLVEVGHRRIVMLTRSERRNSGYGGTEQVFLEALEGHGIQTGPYNIPDWEESAEGLSYCLEKLFQVTSPTAIFVSDATFCLAVKNYLAAHRGRDLRNVALICTEYHINFDWCAPPIAHFRWEPDQIVRRVARWVNNVAKGKEDRRQNLFPAKFIGGETLGRV